MWDLSSDSLDNSTARAKDTAHKPNDEGGRGGAEKLKKKKKKKKLDGVAFVDNTTAYAGVCLGEGGRTAAITAAAATGCGGGGGGGGGGVGRKTTTHKPSPKPSPDSSMIPSFDDDKACMMPLNARCTVTPPFDWGILITLFDQSDPMVTNTGSSFSAASTTLRSDRYKKRVVYNLDSLLHDA